MKKTLLGLFTLALLLVLGSGLLSSCSRRTVQQKKTSWYRHHSGGKSEPCPCGH
jgi:hypothetical protein